MNTPRLAAAACVLATLWPGLAAAQPAAPAVFAQRYYIANDDHTDFMWSADADTYGRVFVDQLDFHLNLIDQTEHQPPRFRARFNTDGSHWLWNYERRKTPAEFERLVQRLKDGSISSPLNPLVLTYGAQPLEAVLRGMYYAGRLERGHGLRFRIANATENQTLPRGLASLFAGAGAPYTYRGVCACASHIPTAVLKERPQEVYWAAGPDGQRQLMKWYSVGPHNVGTYWEAGEPEAALRWVQTDPGFLRRHVDPATKKPFEVIGLFGFGGDDLARKTGVPPAPETPAVPGLQKVPSGPYVDHFHVLAQRLSTPQRAVVASNLLDYFADLERSHGASLPTRSVSFGNEWDLYSASMSETSARVKRAVEQLRSAELLATLVSLQYPRFMDKHRGARDEAFQDIGLYYEHNWTADGPVTRVQRAAWQDKLAANIEYHVRSLQAEALIRLGGMVAKTEGSNRFFVFNALGWARSGAADHLHSGSSEVHVHDLSAGQDVPHQIVRRDQQAFIRILAADVPAAGYKVFEIRSGPGRAASHAAASVSEPDSRNGRRVLDNGWLRVEVARDGAITSLIDKRRGGVELAATIDGLALNDLAANSEDGEALQVEDTGPVSVTLRARSAAGLMHDSWITLTQGSDRVDIRNHITQNFGDVRHWAFSFSMAQPRVHSEEVGAINLNRREAEGGHVADTHARVDHITLNHFADIAAGTSAGQTGPGVTLSSPDLSFARMGRSTHQQLDALTPQLNVLAGGQVDGPHLGIRQQNGNSLFLQRFALRPHGGYSASAAMKMALEHQNPLLAATVFNKSSGAYPGDHFSLLQSDHPDVLLWAVKPADDGIGNGVIARLWNVSDQTATAGLTFHGGLAAAERVSHVETPPDPPKALAVQDGSGLQLPFAPQQLLSLRLTPQPAPPGRTP